MFLLCCLSSCVLLIQIITTAAGGVGKSALTVRFIRSIFLDHYDPTIEGVWHFFFPCLGAFINCSLCFQMHTDDKSKLITNSLRYAPESHTAML